MASLDEWLPEKTFDAVINLAGEPIVDAPWTKRRKQVLWDSRVTLTQELVRQRTRWGSCSRSGTISLNACLLFQPAPVARYLFVHELAHTRQMNHSSRFWRLVEDFEPDWRGLDRDLMRGLRHVPDWVFG